MLPKPINPLTLQGLKDNHAVFETAKAQIDAHNSLISSLGPGTAINGKDFAASQGLTVSGLSGTFKRGKVTIVAGQGTGSNPKVLLNFPKGLFTDQPFAIVQRNGGTGNLNHNYSETPAGLMIFLEGTPTVGSIYTFQWAVRE